MSKHIKGPWKAVGSRVYTAHPAPHHVLVAITAEQGGGIDSRISWNKGEGFADARIIAKAPELLEMLEKVTEMLEAHIDDEWSGTSSYKLKMALPNTARKLIKKAKGDL